MKKSLIIILAFLNISFAYAADMTPQEQEDKIQDIAKGLRRNLWRSGHEDVDSYEEKVELAVLNDHVRKENNSHYEQPLDREEIAKLFKCFHRSSCELYYIGTSGEYWGGYGAEAHFVLLNIKTKKYELISHVVYAE